MLERLAFDRALKVTDIQALSGADAVAGSFAHLGAGNRVQLDEIDLQGFGVGLRHRAPADLARVGGGSSTHISTPIP